MNRAANGRLAEAISLGDVNISAILAPVHQRQQRTVFQRVLGLAPRKMRTERLAHLVESRGPHTRQALEDTLGLSFQVGVEHANSILELRKRSIMFLIDRDERQKQQVAKADDIHKSVEDQSAEIYQQ